MNLYRNVRSGKMIPIKLKQGKTYKELIYPDGIAAGINAGNEKLAAEIVHRYNEYEDLLATLKMMVIQLLVP